MSERPSRGPKDLRSFLQQVEQAPGEEIVRVAREVSPVHELSAVVKLMESRGNPVIRFDRVEGCALPVVAGLQGTRERIALALGVPVEECVEWFLERLEQPIPSERVDAGPVKAVKHLGADVDLGALPLAVHSAQQAGRYFTSGCLLVREPLTGNVNTGIYRMMVKGRNRITIATYLPSDLATVVERSQERGMPVEFAIVVGHHPALLIGSQAKNPMSLDALALSGALAGEPILVTPAESVDIAVPAYAEVVVEGRVLPEAREPEGPFGEYTYYYGTGSGYVAEITAITHREDAIFVDLHPVHSEHRCLLTFPGREARLLAKLREELANVTAVHMPPHGAGMSAYISIDKRSDGEAKRALMIALSTSTQVKHAVVVDSDVDVLDERQVLWALNLRFQGDRDLIVVTGTQGTNFDPSASVPEGVTTKLGFDATVPTGASFPARADILPERYANIDLSDYLDQPVMHGK